MMKKSYPNYPDGVEAVQFGRAKGLRWAIHYTPRGEVKGRMLGIIKQTRNGQYLISGYDEHPVMRSKTSAIWWLYDHEVGLERRPYT